MPLLPHCKFEAQSVDVEHSWLSPHREHVLLPPQSTSVSGGESSTPFAHVLVTLDRHVAGGATVHDSTVSVAGHGAPLPDGGTSTVRDLPPRQQEHAHTYTRT